MAKNNNTQDITFEIVEHIGDISLSSSGWTRELNRVSFNGREARWDLRSWNSSHTRMSKGLSFCDKEMETLAKLLKDRF